MFLRNFYNSYASSIMGVENRTADNNDRESNYRIIGLTGAVIVHGDSAYSNNLPSIANLSPSCTYGLDKIMFGTSNTPVTYNDTEFTPITGLTFATTKTTDVIYSGGKWHRQLEFTITNKNTSDVEINEIAFVNNAYAQSNPTRDYSYIYYRDVLDVTVVIAPDETVKFIYQCTFTM